MVKLESDSMGVLRAAGNHYRSFPTVFAVVVVLLGSSVLAGWGAESSFLIRIRDSWPAMQPLAALCYVLAGLALYFHQIGQRRVVVFLLLPLAVIPVGSLWQDWSGYSLGIDGLLFPQQVQLQPGLRHPGRLVPITAAEFLLFCAFLACPRQSSGQYRLASRIATLGLLIACSALAGYLLGAEDRPRAGFTLTSVHGAFSFALLFGGALLTQRDRNWLRRLLRPSTGARLARQLLGHIVGWPLLLGFLLTLADPWLANPRLGFAVYIVVLTAMLIMVVLRFARRFDLAEVQRHWARDQLGISEARLSGILASTQDAIITIDASQRIVYLNPAAEATFGYSAQEAMGAPIDIFIPDRFRAAHGEQVRRFGETGITTRRMGRLNELTALRKDGGEFPIEASISQSGQGAKKLFTVILRDVTERLETERVMRQQAMLLDLAPDPIMVWDREGGIVFWNNGCRELYGYGREEALGVSSHELLKTVFPRSLAACLAELAETGRWAGELLHTTRSGEVVVVSSHMLQLEAGDRMVVLEANRSITETKRLEESLRQLTRDLERRVDERTAELTRSNRALLSSNMELERFAHAAAHDLQTPLRSIVGFTQLIQKDLAGQHDERIDEWLSYVVENTKRLQILIRELLAYSRLNAQAKPFEPVDLRSAFAEAVSSLKALIEESGAQVSAGELPTLAADRTQIAQLLQNLIENGVKYNRSQPPRVRVSSRRQGEEWIVSVADNGIGIDAKHHRRIFEIFSRLHNYQQIPGSGIGLAICYRIVERHGGRIWVESQPGEGSVFHFSLPVVQPAVAEM